MTLLTLWFNDMGQHHPRAVDRTEDPLLPLMRYPVGQLRDGYLACLINQHTVAHYDYTRGITYHTNEENDVWVIDGADRSASQLTRGIIQSICQLLQRLSDKQTCPNKVMLAGLGYGACQVMLVANCLEAVYQWLLSRSCPWLYTLFSQPQLLDNDQGLQTLLSDIHQYAGLLQYDLDQHWLLQLKAMLMTLDLGALQQALKMTAFDITLLDPTPPNHQHAGHWLALSPWVSQFPQRLLKKQGRVVQLITNDSDNPCFGNLFAETLRINVSQTKTHYLPLMIGGNHLLLSGGFISDNSPHEYRDYHYAPFAFAIITLVNQLLRQTRDIQQQLTRLIARYQRNDGLHTTDHPYASLRQQDNLLWLNQLARSMPEQGRSLDRHWDAQLMQCYQQHLLPSLPYLWRQHSAFPHVGEHQGTYQPCRITYVHRYNPQGPRYTLEQVPFSLTDRPVANLFEQRCQAEEQLVSLIRQEYRAACQQPSYVEGVVFRKQDPLCVLEQLRERLHYKPSHYHLTDSASGQTIFWLCQLLMEPDERAQYRDRPEVLVDTLIMRLCHYQRQTTDVYLQQLQQWCNTANEQLNAGAIQACCCGQP